MDIHTILNAGVVGSPDSPLHLPRDQASSNLNVKPSPSPGRTTTITVTQTSQRETDAGSLSNRGARKIASNWNSTPTPPSLNAAASTARSSAVNGTRLGKAAPQVNLDLDYEEPPRKHTHATSPASTAESAAPVLRRQSSLRAPTLLVRQPGPGKSQIRKSPGRVSSSVFAPSTPAPQRTRSRPSGTQRDRDDAAAYDPSPGRNHSRSLKRIVSVSTSASGKHSHKRKHTHKHSQSISRASPSSSTASSSAFSRSLPIARASSSQSYAMKLLMRARQHVAAEELALGGKRTRSIMDVVMELKGPIVDLEDVRMLIAEAQRLQHYSMHQADLFKLADATATAPEDGELAGGGGGGGIGMAIAAYWEGQTALWFGMDLDEDIELGFEDESVGEGGSISSSDASSCNFSASGLAHTRRRSCFPVSMERSTVAL